MEYIISTIGDPGTNQISVCLFTPYSTSSSAGGRSGLSESIRASLGRMVPIRSADILSICARTRGYYFLPNSYFPCFSILSSVGSR